jgi:carbamoyl-phosphate synthase large subunit
VKSLVSERTSLKLTGIYHTYTTKSPMLTIYRASMQSTMNFRVPEPGEGLLFGGDITKTALTNIVDYVCPLGYKLYAADQEVKELLESKSKGDVKVEVIDFPKEDKRALREVFKKYDIRGCFNLAKARGKTTLDLDYVMRRSICPPAISQNNSADFAAN